MPLGLYLSKAGRALKKGEASKALEVYLEALRHYRADATFLNDFAWFLLTEEGLKDRKRYLPLALKLALKAVALDGGMNPNSLDTLALALFKSGRVREAVSLQEKAVGLRPRDQGMRDRLDRFRAALSQGR